MQKIHQEYIIHREEEKELVVTLDYENNQRMSNLVVLYDGKNVGYFADVAGAKDGVSLNVPDLGKIDIRINTGWFSKPKIFLMLNGHVEHPAKKKPSTSSDLNSYQKWDKSVKTGSGVLFFISGISILGSIVAILFEVQFLLEMGMGGITMFAGFIFLGLGFAARDISWGGFAALVVALLLYVADSMMMLAMQVGGNMFIRVIFTYLILQAIYASFRLLTTPPEVMGNRYGIIVDPK